MTLLISPSLIWALFGKAVVVLDLAGAGGAQEKGGAQRGHVQATTDAGVDVIRNHPMRVVGRVDVPHTLVGDGAVFGLRR